MAEVLLVPIRLDAFYADGHATLAAPMADFTALPYHYHCDPAQTTAESATGTGGATSGQGSGRSSGPPDQRPPPPPPPGGPVGHRAPPPPPPPSHAQVGPPSPGGRNSPPLSGGPADQQPPPPPPPPHGQGGSHSAPPPPPPAPSPSGGPPDQKPPPPPPSDGAANGHNPFLSNVVMRPPSPLFDGQGDIWTPPQGVHLHWKLPDALATQRVDPTSGGAPRFPQVPNRWLVVVSTQSAGTWTQIGAWVVESDYLSARPEGDPQPCAAGVISFPIAPPDALHDILEASPPPPLTGPTADDLASYPFFYQAPFRCMGRRVDLATWQADTASHEYLSKYNPAGLSAAGYGHPLFAAIYSNCSSVFGCYDPAADGVYPRRYEVIGWYHDPTTDCMALFQNLTGQPHPWAALNSEYQWVPADAADATGDTPALSVYFSRLDITAPLSGAPPSPNVQVVVGNTTSEALSAYLAGELETDPASQKVVEEQLEALGLQAQLRGERVDLAAKFEEVRHDKGFKKIHGGSLWSVRARTAGQSAAASTPSGEVTLPGGLAHLLDEANLAQKAYDDAWNQIDSLRQRAFADWYRLECQLSADTIAGLPSVDDIVSYSQASALTPLQEQAALTGTIAFARTSSGELQVTTSSAGFGPDVTVQYTFAQALAQALQALSAALNAYNAGTAAANASLELYLVRKGAPRFYQPTDPAVLLAGAAVASTGRYTADGTLTCAVVSGLNLGTGADPLTQDLRTNGVSGGAFAAILAQIDTLSAGGGAGFATQTQQPWNPVVLEWQADVWPETSGIGTTAADYAATYVTDNYELDVDAADLKIAVRPSSLTRAETAESYAGRAILTAHAPARLQDAIGAYLMGLTLSDLKSWGLRGQTPGAEVDYNYDLQLFAWATEYFSTPAFPGGCVDPATLQAEALATQQNAIATWMSAQYPFRVSQSGDPALIDLSGLAAGWSTARPVLGDDGLLTTLGDLTAAEQAGEPVSTAVSAFLRIAGENLLAQSLSGFNDALLTRQRDMQLPVWDWRVTQDPAQQNYARDLALSLGHVRTAPLSDATFLPIRSGLMQMPTSSLALVDSFGQFLTLMFDSVTKSERMTLLQNVAASVADPSSIATAAEDAQYVYLPPRLVQENRLNFRWLAADQGDATGAGDETEMNDHPATTPVCGWLVPNNLDGSLAVYGADGSALGSLVQGETGGEFAVVWESAPGVNAWMPMSAIPNPHLGAFVSGLASWGSGGASQSTGFLANVNTALQDIDPKSFAEHPALALLIGRPMAVVRASLGLQVMGLPVVDNSAEAFTNDLTNNLFTRSTQGFEAVSIPVRLGEAQQLDDGLVAYWVEDGSGGFVGSPSLPELQATGEVAQQLTLSVSGTATKLTMLVDPRGVVHATTGILPVKTLDIPPDQYAKVLRTLSVTFLTSPVLTAASSVELPLAEEAGYGWSWLDRPSGHQWNRVPTIATASRYAAFEKQRILEGWLKLSPQAKKATS